MSTEFDIVLVCKKIEHHAAHSGYDQLVNHVPGHIFKTGALARWIQRHPAWWTRHFPCIDPEWYSMEYFATEMSLGAYLNFHRHTLVHILYGENQFRYVGRYKGSHRNRVVVSFHQPSTAFTRAIPDPSPVVRTADAIIVVGSSQVPYFREFTKHDNIHVVPHGVDVDFFCPPPQRCWEGPLQCMVVGWWLRDVETIKTVMTRLADISGAQIHFNVVTFPWCCDFYRDLPNVTLYSTISDEALRELYQRSHLLFLPLIDCTANNAVLESLASGLPVFTTHVGSISDYVSDDVGVTVASGDTDGLIALLRRAEKERDWLIPMSVNARKQAFRFAWPRIGKEMMQSYRIIMA